MYKLHKCLNKVVELEFLFSKEMVEVEKPQYIMGDSKKAVVRLKIVVVCPVVVVIFYIYMLCK